MSSSVARARRALDDAEKPQGLVAAIARQFRLNRIQKFAIRVKAFNYGRHLYRKRTRAKNKELNSQYEDRLEEVSIREANVVTKEADLSVREAECAKREEKLREDMIKIRNLAMRLEGSAGHMQRGAATLKPAVTELADMMKGARTSK